MKNILAFSLITSSIGIWGHQTLNQVGDHEDPHLNAAVMYLEEALSRAPSLFAQKVRAIQSDGPVKAFLYDNPDFNAERDAVARSTGLGLKALGDLVARDMSLSAQQQLAQGGAHHE